MLLFSRAETFFQRGEFTSIDFLIDLFGQVAPATAGRKIPLHLSVPGLFFKLLKPFCQFAALRFCKLFNRGFDRVYGHIASLTFVIRECKCMVIRLPTSYVGAAGACSAARCWKISM